MFRLAERERIRLLETVTVARFRQRARRDRGGAIRPRLRPRLDYGTIDTWRDVVLNRYAVDWRSAGERTFDPSTVTVVVPTVRDWRMTTTAVRSVVQASTGSDHRVEVLVVANGSDDVSSVVMDSLPLRFPQVRILHSPVNHGFALGNNLALAQASGSIVVFLDNDAEVRLGWLDALADALSDPNVLAAQSLLLYPDGSVQSAGVSFARCGGIPHVLLAHFPAEDADPLRDADLFALTGAALAMRTSDAVALRGFDPLFRNGMEDIDLCLRLRKIRAGRLVVRPDSRVVHYESMSPNRLKHHLVNRRLLIDRWGDELIGDDELWRRAGFEVAGYHVRGVPPQDSRLGVPEPIVLRRTTVNEASPRLRSAIKNPAPADPSAELWGDTHYARRLADALRERGHSVVIDHRPAFYRSTSHLDDVVVVLRGLARFRPVYGQVSIGWLISHPEMLSPLRGRSLRPARRGQCCLVEAHVPRVEHTHRSHASSNGSGSVQPGPGKAGHGPSGALRRRVAAAAPAHRAGRCGFDAAVVGLRARVGGTHPSTLRQGGLDALRGARLGVPGRRGGPERPLGGHASRGLRLEPSL